eukprot:11846107-Ditylum_brightwellii.AAC.1
MIKGHVVIHDMLQSNIQLVSATIDLFGKEGPATRWLHTSSTSTSTFDATAHNFGNAVGTPVGIEMCQHAMRDPDLCNILGKAGKEWRACHGGATLL